MGKMHTKAERTEKVEEIKAEKEEKSGYYIQTVYACYCTGNCYGTGAYYNYSIQS